MGIDFPNSPSSGDTYTYEGETYRYNGVAFVKVRERVTTFNGVTGAIVGVNSVNGETGDVTLSVGGSDGVQRSMVRLVQSSVSPPFRVRRVM